MAINSGAINSFEINGTPSYSGPTATVTGRGFSQHPTVSGQYQAPNTVTGRSFRSTPAIFGGAVVTGRGFQTNPTIEVSFTYNGYVTGYGFDSTPIIEVVSSSSANIIGRGFKQSQKIFGGAIVTGRGFKSAPTISVVGSEYATVTGRGFLSSPYSQATAPNVARITGRGFKSTLFYSKITGASFASHPVVSLEYSTEYAEAFVMNTLTKQVSRYQNYPFLHIAKISGSYYGIKENGIYLLSGTIDDTTEVNGTIWTGDIDFGVYNSKNTPYLYINGDDTYRVTAYVDSVEQPRFTSGFSGRRVKLARGNKGRYWSFKIQGINKLQGIEFMPDMLSRRVK